jgi:phosphatidylglycerophosphatase A
MATGAYLGFFTPAPGTVGSLLGLILLWPLGAGVLHLLATLVLIVAAVPMAERAAQVLGERDPRPVIIDEVAGIAVATALLPGGLLEQAIAWVLFRLFDITKPFPASHAEDLTGGLGIVADDLVAGLYANLVVRVWLFIS